MAQKRHGVNHRKKASAAPPSAERTGQKRIRFEYIKSNCFRVIRVDGVNGSPTPRADGIQMAFFSERMPIPKSEEFLVKEDGKLGDRLQVEGRSAIVREVEVEAILSLATAKSLCVWLEQKIKTAEEIAVKGVANAK